MDDPSTFVPANLFKDVKYYFIGSIPKSIETILNAGGGKKDQYLSEILTHCIADEDDGEVNEAKELFQLAVVKSSWVIQSAKCGCLLPTSLFDPDSKVNIFSKVVACPSQILAADNKVLWSLVTTHGGEYVTRLDKKVTHLLTSSSTGVKYDLAMKHSDSIHIVTPDWVVDSCTSKQRLVEARYHPRLLQPVPARITTPTETAPSAMETSTADQPDKPVEVRSPEPTVSCRLKTPPLSVKKSPKADSHGTKEALARIVVSRQQTSNLHFKESLNMPEKEMLVPSLKLTLPIPALATRVAKTSISPAVSTPAIVPYSCAPVISTACTAPVTATPAAASAMLPSNATSTIMTVPTQVPTQVPNQVPTQVPTQVPNKSPSRSTLRNIANGSEPRNQKSSNKANSAKISQLMTNISQMPRQMSPVRPGLVAYPPLPAGKNHVQGDVKLYYGHDPGEHVPEDACLLGCVFYITDYQKQLEPASLDVWKRVISQYGGQVDDSYSNRITHVLCEHQKSDVFQLALQDGKRLVTAHWLNDCLLMKKMSIPWTSLHFPYFFGKEKPCANQIICVTNFSGEDRTNIKHMILLLGAKYTGYMTRANSVLIAKWSGGTKLNKAKEWNIPVVNVTWLNDLILGDLNALKLPVHSRYTTFTPDDPFRIDQSRVARLLEGWKVPVKISKETWKKFQSFQMLRPNLGMPGSYYNVPPARSLFNGGSSAQKRHAESDGDMVEKRMRLDPNRSPMVLITGIPRVAALYLAQEVERLGGCVVNSARSCTHLVSSSILRTVKFLTALNLAKFIVTPDWIEQSAKMNRFLDEGHFPICDEIAESTYNFRFRETLRRTKERKLFEGLAFYITPSVLPGKSILGEIVENAGGRILDSLPPLNEVVKCVNNRGEPTLIVVTCEDDVYICHDLINKNIGIHNAEFILTGVLRQEVDYFSYRLNESTVS